MSHFACRLGRQVERVNRLAKDVRGHPVHRLADLNMERQLLEQGIELELGRDFDQVEPRCSEPEDGPLRDIENFLVVLPGLVGAERQMLDALNKLLVAPLEREAERHQPRALRDVDEAAGTDDTAAQATDVDVAKLIDLAGAHEGGVETATVVEVKLARVGNDRGRVRRDAEVDATRWDSPVDAGFDRQRDRVGQARFGEGGADRVPGNAGPDVDDVALV